MSGYAERGPVPKRSTARRRRNKTDEDGHSTEVQKVELDLPPVQERPVNPNWHPAAKAIWQGAVDSGVTIFWEPSDWAILGLICSQISQEYRDDLIVEKIKLPGEGPGEGGGEEVIREARPMPAGKMTAILKGLGSLGLTEGDRRRMHIELERFGQPDEEPTAEEVRQAQLELLQGGKTG